MGRVYEAYDSAFFSVSRLRSALRTNSDGGGAGTVAAMTARRLSRTAVEWMNGVGLGELPVDGEVKFTPSFISIELASCSSNF